MYLSSEDQGRAAGQGGHFPLIPQPPGSLTSIHLVGSELGSDPALEGQWEGGTPFGLTAELSLSGLHLCKFLDISFLLHT